MWLSGNTMKNEMFSFVKTEEDTDFFSVEMQSISGQQK